jgi:hypothetical protein
MLWIPFVQMNRTSLIAYANHCRSLRAPSVSLFIAIKSIFTVRKKTLIPRSFGNRINCAAIPPPYVDAMVTVVSAPQRPKFDSHV